MQKRITKGSAKYWFDSQADFARYLETTPRTWSYRSAESGGRDKAWDLGAGYKGAWDMARDGWLEGAERAQEALKAFQPATPHPATRNDFYGHMPNVPRFCAGAPDNMIRHTTMQPESGSSKVLTLIVPITANAGTRAEYMANYGVGVAQYVNQLEADGQRVEVIGVFVTLLNRRDRVSMAWSVKQADQPLDLAVLAFSIGHPAMLRRIGFALLERCDKPQDAGYGAAQTAVDTDVINAPLGAIVLAGMGTASYTATTPKQALETISAEIEAALTGKG